MVAREVISEEIPPLKITDTGVRALSWMDEFKVAQLPVVNGKQYLGLISDTDILDLENPELPIKDQNIQLVKPFVFENVHIYDLMKLVSELNLGIVPILDMQEQYLGSTNVSHLMNLIVHTASISEPGGVIILEMNQHDYSMSQIAQIIEGNDAKILSSYVTSAADSTLLEITLKLNKTDLSRILQTFYRYEYNVTASYQKSGQIDDLRNNYEALMNYLKF